MLVFQVRDTLLKIIILSSSYFAANIIISLFSVAAFVLRMGMCVVCTPWHLYVSLGSTTDCLYA